MPPARKSMLALAGLLSAGAAIWAFTAFAPRTPQVCTAASPPCTRPAVRGTRATPAVAALRRTPLPTGPFDRIEPVLAARANAGDAAAAYRLALVLDRCSTYEPMADSAFSRWLARAVASMPGGLRIGGQAVQADDLIDMALFAREQIGDLCDGTGALRRSPHSGEAFAWIERAAQGGQPEAMAAYADYAFRAFPTLQDLLDNAEEVARRRRQARLYLERAIALREPTAYLALARAHGPEGVLPPDPVRAYAAWRVYRSTAAGQAMPPRLLAIVERQFSQGLTPSTMAQAEALALRWRAPSAGGVR